MVVNRDIMRMARQSLQGKWNFMALVTLIYMIILGGSSLAGAVGTILITGAMGIGYFALCQKIARGEEYDLVDLFSGFKIFLKSFLLYLVAIIFIFLWTILFVIPGIVATFRYSFICLIALNEPNLSAMEIIAKSKELTYGFKWQIFCLVLRFLGWFILSFMTFGIGFLWSIPYFSQSLTHLYLEVMHKRNEVQS